MRDRVVEKFVVLPFSIGCTSYSSVSVANDRPRVQASASLPKDERRELGDERPKNQYGLSWGIQRVIKGFKELSQMFTSREEEEEEEREMVIGFPTDVMHVGHIGWDGSRNFHSTMKGWNHDHMGMASDLFSLPSISFKHLEVSMSKQVHP